MRILLDAKDLINVVEHNKPIAISELDIWLRERRGNLVYSLANIRALVAPISIDTSQVFRIREYVEQLEQLPHCYISDPTIDLMELRSAILAFEAGEEYAAIDPFVRRFDFVFPRFAEPNKSIYHLWDVVHDLWRACPPQPPNLIPGAEVNEPWSDPRAIVCARAGEIVQIEIEQNSSTQRAFQHWAYRKRILRKGDCKSAPDRDVHNRSDGPMLNFQPVACCFRTPAAATGLQVSCATSTTS